MSEELFKKTFLPGKGVMEMTAKWILAAVLAAFAFLAVAFTLYGEWRRRRGATPPAELERWREGNRAALDALGEKQRVKEKTLCEIAFGELQKELAEPAQGQGRPQRTARQ
ncbi:MAG: hypothetical protein WCW25_00255 [Patescibacteria group bacterium]